MKGVLFVVVWKWVRSKEKFILRCNVEWKQQDEARWSCNDICVGQKWKVCKLHACIVVESRGGSLCTTEALYCWGYLMNVSGAIHGRASWLIIAISGHADMYNREELAVCAARRLDFCSIWELKGWVGCVQICASVLQSYGRVYWSKADTSCYLTLWGWKKQQSLIRK